MADGDQVQHNLIAITAPYRLCIEIWCGQRRNHGWIVEGDESLGPNTGALALRDRPIRPGWVLGAKGGSPFPAVRVRGYQPRKIFENSNAKSCILVTTMLIISGLTRTWNFLLFKNYSQVGPIHCWSPSLKVVGTSLPRSLQMLRLCWGVGPTRVRKCWICRLMQA